MSDAGLSEKTRRRRVNGNTPRAEERRAALRRVLKDRDLTLLGASRAAGLSTPTALGNFLRGHAASLHLDTAEPLARALGISLNQLVGDDDWRRIDLRGHIATDELQAQYCWPNARWLGMVIPSTARSFDGTSYYLRLETREMDEIYPQNTLLEIVDLADFDRPLVHGNRVIVLRTVAPAQRGRRPRQDRESVEVSCREIASDGGTAACRLVTRSTDPRYKDRGFAMPWPLVPGHVEQIAAGELIEVAAVVIRSLRNEIEL